MEEPFTSLMSLFGLENVSISEEVSYSQLIQSNLINGDHIIAASAPSGTIVFSLELFNDDDSLKRISLTCELMGFTMLPKENSFYFKIYKNGHLIRDNYSDDDFKEVGKPIELELKGYEGIELFSALMLDYSGIDLNDLNGLKFYKIPEKKSFWSNFFNREVK